MPLVLPFYMSKDFKVVDFTRNELEQLYSNHCGTAPLSVWSPFEVKLLSDTVPYTARNIFEISYKFSIL